LKENVFGENKNQTFFHFGGNDVRPKLEHLSLALSFRVTPAILIYGRIDCAFVHG